MKKLFLFVFIALIASYSFGQTYSVTFHVNMNAQKNYGFFDPSLSTAKVRGTFNSWNETAMSDSNNDGIYDVTINGISDSIEYKFFYKDKNGVDRWEEISNRSAKINSNTELPVVYFMNDEGSSVTVNVLFKVNMEFEIASGRFNPHTDVVYVRGNFNGWSTADTCLPSAANINIYKKMVPYIAKVADTIHYKFNINDSNWEVDFWGNTGGHRLIGISQTDINNKTASDPFIYPNEYFNGLDPNTLTGQNCEITFSVDVNNATDLNGAAFSEIKNVFLCGNVAPLGWGWNVADSAKNKFMFDDGTHGDKVAGDNIWTVKVVFPQYTMTTPFNYKYGINYNLPSNNGTNDNENAPGQDHFIQLTSNLVSASVRNVFGVATTSGNPHTLENVVLTAIHEVGNTVPSAYALQQNYPNPFNPSTKIQFSIPFSSDVRITVYDILGNEVKTLLSDHVAAGNYSADFNTESRLASGIYLCKITAFSKDGNNSSFSKTIKMTLLK